jgi:hypothetical protein
MDWNRSADEITAAWQSEIETKLEAGATPLLIAGAPTLVYNATPALLALQSTVLLRRDLTIPLLVAGGTGALWPAVLLAPLGHTGAPEPMAIYGGADPAAYLATLATLTTGAAAPPTAVASGTPPDVAPWLAPRLQPGAPAPWEALPLVEAGERPAAVPAGAPLLDPMADWIAWGAMLLALCLVLSALLI